MVITDVIVCDVNGERPAEVRIENAKIVEVGSRVSGEPRVSANGAYLMPGLVDTNIRLKDAQMNGKNLESLAQEALKGGVVTAVLAPDSMPAVDNTIVLEFVQSTCAHTKGAKIETTINSVNDENLLSNIAILLKKGAVAPYMSTNVDTNIASRIAEYVKMYGVTLHCKAEDESLSSSGIMVEGAVATRLGLGGISPLSESSQVAKMIEIARHFNVSVLFKSIANPRSVELITQAKAEGVQVACEVSIHHLLHCDEACDGFNTTAKLDPPLATRKDMSALQEALKNGQIDMLTSLHQPNSLVNKEVAFFDASNGCEAVADALPLYYTKLVQSGMISLSRLVELTSAAPAKAAGEQSGSIAAGEKADLVLFDPKGSHLVSNAQSLYDGEELSGRVVMAIRAGEIIRL